jgi:hypothetical protein
MSPCFYVSVHYAYRKGVRWAVLAVGYTVLAVGYPVPLGGSYPATMIQCISLITKKLVVANIGVLYRGIMGLQIGSLVYL